MDLRNIFQYIPEVRKPEEKKLSFNVKLKWTIIVLVLFFLLSGIPLYGLSNNALENFKFFATVLGADFGSLISLGVGPIVMASIILQLLVGAQIIQIDTATPEGRKFFQGIQKILVFFFIVFEAMVFVMMQGLQAVPGFTSILIFQLILGGLAIFYMDDLMQKWGFGSGVSMFIAAGVSWNLIARAFQFIGKDPVTGGIIIQYSGKIFVFIQSLVGKDVTGATSALAAILVTILIFLMVVWAQSLKVEIPLSFGRLRGYSVKWPLVFFYASVIPVILVAALMANLQLFGGLMENAAQPCFNDNSILDRSLETCTGGAKISSFFTFLGKFTDGIPIGGFAFWIGSTNIVDLLIRKSFSMIYLWQALVHTIFFVIFATLFSVFWVKTANIDSKAQAKNIMASGLQVSGFRQDERVLESILDRYIMPLTVMGGAAVGLLASLTDLFGALVSGTAMLLVIMIMFQFYQNIAKQHEVDMHPAVRKFMGGG